MEGLWRDRNLRARRAKFQVGGRRHESELAGESELEDTRPPSTISPQAERGKSYSTFST
jgi:hypothetical protein